MIDAIFFDLDGTMWDTTEACARLWSLTASHYPDAKDTITAETLRNLYGLPLPDIAVEIFKCVGHERAIEIMLQCVKDQCPVLAEDGAKLIGNVEDALRALKEKYMLFIISNCENGYIEAFLKSHDFGKYFVDFTCPGQTGLLKADNIKLMKEKYGLTDVVYVGDTDGDRVASEKAGVPFVFAAYGFGTAKSYDYKIDSITDLITLFDEKDKKRRTL